MKPVDVAGPVEGGLERREPLLDRILPGGRPLFAWWRRIVSQLRGAGRDEALPEVEGFRRHGWSGKLYLLLNGAVFVISTPLALAFAIVVALSADGGQDLAIAAAMAVFVLGSAVIYWRVLRGVARFHMGARRLAMLLLGVSVVAGTSVLAGDSTAAEKLAWAAEIAVSAQFFAYFVRTRDEYLSREERERLGRGVDADGDGQGVAADAGSEAR